MTNHPYKGRGQAHATHWKFYWPNHINGMAEGRVVTFCTQAGYIKCWPCDDRLPSTEGVVRVSRSVRASSEENMQGEPWNMMLNVCVSVCVVCRHTPCWDKRGSRTFVQFLCSTRLIAWWPSGSWRHLRLICICSGPSNKWTPWLASCLRQTCSPNHLRWLTVWLGWIELTSCHCTCVLVVDLCDCIYFSRFV